MGGLTPFATGTLLILTTGLFFGSQTSFAKAPSVITSGVRMEIFNIYFIIGVGIINFLVYFACLIYGSHITFTYLGVLSALFLYFGELFVLLSVKQIGIAYSMAISIFSATITSCIIEVFLGQTIVYWSIVIVGVLITAISCACIALLKNILRYTNFMNYRVEELVLQTTQANQHIQNNAPQVNVLSELTPLNDNPINSISDEQTQTPALSKRALISDGKQMFWGGLWTSISGVFFASIPLPSLFTDATNSGIFFSLSFGIGCLIVFPLSLLSVIITNPFYGTRDVREFDGFKTISEHLFYFRTNLWHFKETFWCGLCAGLVWGIGNICGICSFLYLDYVVVNAFIQTHIIWTLFYGIFLFKEIQQNVEIVIIIGLSMLLVVGCILVAYGTYGEW